MVYVFFPFSRSLTVTRVIAAAVTFTEIFGFNLFPVVVGSFVEEQPEVWTTAVSVATTAMAAVFCLSVAIGRTLKVE